MNNFIYRACGGRPWTPPKKPAPKKPRKIPDRILYRKPNFSVLLPWSFIFLLAVVLNIIAYANRGRIDDLNQEVKIFQTKAENNALIVDRQVDQIKRVMRENAELVKKLDSQNQIIQSQGDTILSLDEQIQAVQELPPKIVEKKVYVTKKSCPPNKGLLRN